MKHSEQSFQISLVRDLQKILPAPECYITAFPAGGGGKIRGAFLKRMGMRSGFPDMLLIYRGWAFGMELKTVKGAISATQREAHKELGFAGMDVRVVRSLDDALAALRTWGIPTRIKEEWIARKIEQRRAATPSSRKSRRSSSLPIGRVSHAE